MNKERFQFDERVGFIDTKKYGGDTLSNKDVVVLLNEMNNENKILRESLKNKYICGICENCIYGEYWINWEGEGEFECHKGHEAWRSDGLKECTDFELKINEQ